MLSAEVARSISPGDHGTTYGGNLLACRAALVFLDALERDGVLVHIGRMSGRLFDGLRRLQSKHAPLVTEVRGAGLMAGLDLQMDATPVIAGALERGLLVNRTATTVVRLLPAYVVGEAEIDEAIGILDETFGAVGQ
jgi:acetylornithine/succinyldiaminopimelate/putrescine aminotransferase